MYYLSAYEGLPYPCRGLQKCGDGKPSPYSGEIERNKARMSMKTKDRRAKTPKGV